jgi:hypothetical protein
VLVWENEEIFSSKKLRFSSGFEFHPESNFLELLAAPCDKRQTCLDWLQHVPMWMTIIARKLVV